MYSLHDFVVCQLFVTSISFLLSACYVEYIQITYSTMFIFLLYDVLNLLCPLCFQEKVKFGYKMIFFFLKKIYFLEGYTCW